MTASAFSSRSGDTVLPGFAHISRSFDRDHHIQSARVLPGEYYVTSANEMITTVLGSCVAACIRDPDTGVGGMNHFMLPGDTTARHDRWAGEEGLVTRYGVAAMETLINDILKLGARKDRLELKLFGGGEVLKMELNNIGRRNVEFVREFVRAEGFSVAAEDLGGPYPRKVNFFPKSGRVLMRRLRALQKNAVATAEASYASTLKQQPTTGSIDLFD